MTTNHTPMLDLLAQKRRDAGYHTPAGKERTREALRARMTRGVRWAGFDWAGEAL